MALYRGNTMIASYGKISGSECRASELSSRIEELATKIDGLSNDFGLSSQMLSAMIVQYGGGGGGGGITIYQGDLPNSPDIIQDWLTPGGYYLTFQIDNTSYIIENSDQNIYQFRMKKTLPSNCNWVVASKSSSPINVIGTTQYWNGLNSGYASKIGMQFDLTLTKHNILINRSTRWIEWTLDRYSSNLNLTPVFSVGDNFYWLENIENFVVPGGSKITFTISVSRDAIDYSKNFQINYKLPLMPVY